MIHLRVTAIAMALWPGAMCLAQHTGDVLTQSVDGRLTSIGQRVFSATLGSFYTVLDPGWNSLAVGSPAMPSGAQALPPNADLEWDFLPMKIAGAISNLFYWDGIGAVEFGTLPGDEYEFGLQGEAGFELVYGTQELVPGGVIDDTSSLGAMHVHRTWYLDDGDGSLATDPVDGIYLAAVRTRMSDLDRSAPLYVLFRTLATPAAALTSAASWTDDRVGKLAPDFAADFDGDLDVDGLDFLTWQRGFALAGGGTALQLAGDANFDTAIDSADLAVWESEYGSSLATFAGASGLRADGQLVPEPSAAILVLVATSLRLVARRSVRSRLLGANEGLWSV